MDGSASISVVARRNGVSANLLYRWRRLMLEGGSVAVTGDDDVTSNRLVRQMDQRIRDTRAPTRPQGHRQMREIGAEPVNHFLLARKYEIRPDYGHEGKVVTMRSNLRWCSDGFEFHCWNREVVRGAFIIDAHDRESSAGAL